MKHKFAFDFTRYWHNKKVAKDLMQEILNFVTNHKPGEVSKGVYVRPGQRVRYAGLEVTMSPIRHNQSNPYFYWDDGVPGSAMGWKKVTTLGGERVLGYENDTRAR